MRCPHCHKNGSRVIDSRPTDGGSVIRRRRKCENCGFRYTTFERIEKTPLLVIKKNGTREEFNREKILRGIIRSAEKRPIPMSKMISIVDHVENKIRSLGLTEVSSRRIGEYVMHELSSVDEIAYVRFASVYRQFKDMTEFYHELKEVMDRDKTKKEHQQKQNQMNDQKSAQAKPRQSQAADEPKSKSNAKDSSQESRN
ncbi:transcriptional repressor NrdR [uncultured bacterium]|uniref:Transcriptional repressor NrdR n=1 Tax=Acetilactobacillus jinshanensis TaxID=1720083 RepID=A0A4P6ZLI9_9LACO|nr:transcriptional repressor NrdR [Acetilactobacillus jinshanensis]URL61552.1 transcriptional repressor NrdR [uncultured bacterium]